ncbi:MAG: ABC transporter substrate-binding protein [Betaproteobacteria bacterium]|nr:ABC transporter substrate-binding protein [Betaproteobacteria bacterium]
MTTNTLRTTAMHHQTGRKLVSILAVLGACAMLSVAQAQNVPPVRMVVGSAPGGPSDIAARILAEKLRTRLNRNVLVENRAGAATRIANAEVKKATPDGTTLLFSPLGAMTVLPNLFTAKNLGYAPEDFVPVSRVVGIEFLLAAGPNLKVDGISQFKTFFSQKPELASFANPGTGTIPNLLAIVLAKHTGVPFRHIAYKGSSLALNDLMGDHVALAVGTPAEMLEQHKAGKIRVIGTFSEKRSQLLPDVATLKEQGVPLAIDDAFGVWAPAGTPKAVIDSVNAAIVNALEDPGVKAEFMKLGFTAASSTPAELGKIQQEDLKRWNSFIQQAGISMTD